MIILEDNNGFVWKRNKGIYAKGYIYIDNNIYIKNDILSLFESVSTYNEFINIINICNGNFSVVIERKDEVWFAVDRARSFGLFYSTDGKFISDSVKGIIENMNTLELDEVSISEQILSSYVYGNNTAFVDVKQLQLGECGRVKNGKIELNRYYIHFSQRDSKIRDEEFLLEKLEEVTQSIFNRLIKSLDNRRVVVPLSGGYDSRYIISMLKKLGYENVICYTYGDKNQYEVQYSKKVANELGYKWHFIEYTDEEWDSMINDEFYSYCNYCHNFSSTPHIQDYLALRKLKENNVVNENDIIINGFCGDLPAGSFVKPKEDEQYVNYDIQWITNYIFEQNYNHIPSTKFQKDNISKRIKMELECLGGKVTSFDEFINIYEAWFSGARPSKWVVNSNRLYEFFGLEWRMPLWDNEFLEFWYSVSNNLRRDTYLYQRYLFENLFIPMKIDMRKPSFIRSLSIEYNKSLEKRIKVGILYIITIIQIYFGIILYKRNDVNNYTALTMLILKKVKNKKYLNHKNLYAHQILAFWWCENIYGVNNIKSICGRKR